MTSDAIARTWPTPTGSESPSPAWKRRIIVCQSGMTYFPAALGGAEAGVVECARLDGVAPRAHRGAQYLPEVWLRDECPDSRPYIDLYVRAVTEAQQAAAARPSGQLSDIDKARWAR